MGKETRTRIEIETDRTLIVARLNGARFWCEQCGSEVEVVAGKKHLPLPPEGPPMLDAAEDSPRWNSATRWRSRLRAKSVRDFLGTVTRLMKH